jgi:hypothetical protein
MQRVLVELIGASKQVVKQCVFALDIANEERLRQFSLVAEMIEEPALGYADSGNQLVDRGSGKTLVEDRRFGGIENALAGITAFALRGSVHAPVPRRAELYHEYS